MAVIPPARLVHAVSVLHGILGRAYHGLVEAGCEMHQTHTRVTYELTPDLDIDLNSLARLPRLLLEAHVDDYRIDEFRLVRTPGQSRTVLVILLAHPRARQLLTVEAAPVAAPLSGGTQDPALDIGDAPPPQQLPLITMAHLPPAELALVTVTPPSAPPSSGPSRVGSFFGRIWPFRPDDSFDPSAVPREDDTRLVGAKRARSEDATSATDVGGVRVTGRTWNAILESQLEWLSGATRVDQDMRQVADMLGIPACRLPFLDSVNSRLRAALGRCITSCYPLKEFAFEPLLAVAPVESDCSCFSVSVRDACDINLTRAMAQTRDLCVRSGNALYSVHMRLANERLQANVLHRCCTHHGGTRATPAAPRRERRAPASPPSGEVVLANQ
jgi:hypothetical protein